MAEATLLATHQLKADTQAVLLLCGRFSKQPNSEAKPLTPSEYENLAEWLRQHSMRPANLLTSEGLQRLEEADLALPVGFSRLKLLLDRGGALAMSVEGWSNKGIWVLSRSDEAYPQKLREGRVGPPILYGTGDSALLTAGGLAIVGSRDASEAEVAYTQRLAQACAESGLQVVSGGARGIDTEAMQEALERGGTAVGVLADSLLKSAVAGKYRNYLLKGRLVLVSPYDPAAGFDVGNAMGRNKYIYALADYSIIISAFVGKGGTWAGAVEALKAGRKPIFVRAEGDVPEGNQKLLERGAIPFPPEPWGNLVELLASERLPLQLFDAPEAKEQKALEGSIYDAVLPLLLSKLAVPTDPKVLAEKLDVRPAQLQDWLDKAVQAGCIFKMKKPVRYVAAAVQPQLDLV